MRPHEEAPLLTEQEVSRLLNIKVATLRRWRWAGRGPRYIKVGACVRYRQDELRGFIDANTRGSTSDIGSWR